MLDAWKRFRADEEWRKIKQATNAKYGDLVGEIEDRTLTATNDSPKFHLQPGMISGEGTSARQHRLQ